MYSVFWHWETDESWISPSDLNKFSTMQLIRYEGKTLAGEAAVLDNSHRFALGCSRPESLRKKRTRMFH